MWHPLCYPVRPAQRKTCCSCCDAEAWQPNLRTQEYKLWPWIKYITSVCRSLNGVCWTASHSTTTSMLVSLGWRDYKSHFAQGFGMRFVALPTVDCSYCPSLLLYSAVFIRKTLDEDESADYKYGVPSVGSDSFGISLLARWKIRSRFGVLHPRCTKKRRGPAFLSF